MPRAVVMAISFICCSDVANLIFYKNIVISFRQTVMAIHYGYLYLSVKTARKFELIACCEIFSSNIAFLM